MPFLFFAEDVPLPEYNQDYMISWLSKAIKNELKNEGELCIIFCSDEYLLNYNKQYLDSDDLTDIITFDYSEDNTLSGDLFISIPRVTENASSYKLPLIKELYRVVLHGILHLSGYDDADEDSCQQIKRKEEQYLQQLSDTSM